MTHKSTDELKNELKTAANLRDYLSKNKGVSQEMG